MKTRILISKKTFTAAACTVKTLLLLFAVFFCFSNPVYAGIKPAHKVKHVKRPGSGVRALTVHRPEILSSPTISYASPQTFTAGQRASVAPASGGTTSYGYNVYSNAADTVISSTKGIQAIGITMDAAGDIYFTDPQDVFELPAGGVLTTIASGFNSLIDIKMDASKNIYVSDRGANQVIKIAARTGAKTVIGSGFNSPFGLAFDAAGNLYVSDMVSSTVGEIKKIATGTTTATVFATGFGVVGGLAFDAAGNLFLADDGTNVVKEIPADGGGVITVMQNLGGNNFTPNFLAFDHTGTLFVSAIYFNEFSDVYAVSLFYKLPGGIDTSPGEYDTEDSFSGITTDGAGNVYAGCALTDGGEGNPGVIKYQPTGGFFIDQNLPQGLKFDGNTGIINGIPLTASPSANYTVTAYQTDSATEAITSASAVVNIAVNAVTGPQISYNSPQSYAVNYPTLGTNPISNGGQPGALNYMPTASAVGSGFNKPNGIAKDAAGNLYIADRGNNEVKKMTPGGSITVIGSGFSKPTGVAVDAAGNVYVADNGNNAVKKIPAGSNTPVAWGSGFKTPLGIAVDIAGNVYVADKGNGEVKEISTGGVTTTIGSSGFNSPAGVAVDGSGNVYVADSGSGSVQIIPAGGGFPQLVTVGLSNPFGIAVDNAGDIFVATVNDEAVYIVARGGFTQTLIGQEFYSPEGIMVDSQGNLYIADTGNNEIRLIQPAGGYFFNKPLPAGLVYDSSSGIISGTPTVITPAASYIATAWNPLGNSSTSFSLQVTANALLSGLTLSSGTLNPVFSPGINAYTASVTNNITSITVTPATYFPTSTVQVNGTAVTSGTASGPITLTVGANTITTVVTAQDGITTQTYTATVTRLPSGNAALSALQLSAGTLTPAFAGGTTAYTASVANGVTSIAVIPATADPNATVTVNGTAVTSGSPSQSLPLVVGPNDIATVVTAQDGTTMITYTVTVTRAPSAVATLSSLKPGRGVLSPVFSSATTSYTIAVVNGVTSISFTPTATNPSATIKVDGAVVTSGSASQSIPLVVGANSIPIKVTAQDGATTKTYTIVVTRGPSANCYLANITPGAGALSPTFSAAKTAYTEDVVNGAATITITPATAVPTSTVKVNGAAVASGTASAPISLNVGANTITTVVTAQDGVTTKTYTITVTRAPSANANLSAFKISKGTLTPAFATGTTSYTASVVNGVTSMTVTPTVADTTATIQVNGTAVASGAASGPIALAVGSNTITTIVTAQDGTTTKMYTLTVTRASGGADSYNPGISVTKPEQTPALANDGIVVHQAISPNGDGINDFLQIDNISQYPDNKLSIMNRNGQLIYQTAGYDNSSKVFDGHSNKNGQMQLPGTYFYQLDYTVKGIIKHKTGFLVLKY